MIAQSQVGCDCYAVLPYHGYHRATIVFHNRLSKVNHGSIEKPIGSQESHSHVSKKEYKVRVNITMMYNQSLSVVIQRWRGRDRSLTRCSIGRCDVTLCDARTRRLQCPHWQIWACTTLQVVVTSCKFLCRYKSLNRSSSLWIFRLSHSYAWDK